MTGGWRRFLARLKCRPGRAWRTAVKVSLGGVLLALALLLVGTQPRSSPALTVPTIVSVASVTVPTPTISTPSVPTPAVSTPSLPTPTVPTVSVPKPTPPPAPVPTPGPVHVPAPLPVPTPTVSTPSVPSVSVPAPVRSAPADTGSAPRSQSGSGTGTGSAGPSVPQGSSTPSTSHVAGGSSSSGYATAPNAQSASYDGSAAGNGPRGQVRLLTQQELRRLVSRLRGCLASLTARQTQVLVLRSGLGLRHSDTRRQVAAILHVTLRQEGRIERQATSGLTRASAQGRCANRVTLLRASLLHTLSLLLPLTFPPPASASARPPVQPATTNHPTAKSRHGRVSRATSGQSNSAPNSSSITPPDKGGLNLLLLLLGAIAGLVALWLVRSRPRAQLGGGAVAALPPGTAGESLEHVALTALDTRQPERVTTATEGAGSAASRADGFEASLADGIEAFELGGALAARGDMRGAESAYRRADEQGHPFAASNLGVLLEQRGDLTSAEAAYRRADERGDAGGAFNLGGVLEDRHDLLGAEAAYRRADQRGDAGGALRLGALLAQRNDLFGAEAAFRRAEKRGASSAPASLGVLLEQRGDLAGAEAAYRRADERGDATGAFRLGTALEKQNDLAGAEAAYRRAAERGHGDVEDQARSALTLLRGRH